jgi:hypothetical protein
MVGRLWETEIDPALDAEFERFTREIALPMVRGRMGCSAVFVLREAEGTNRGILTFWLSRKAMSVAAASLEWSEVGRQLARYGITFDLEHARGFEATSHFFAGQ